jgi:hypothetical protein
MLSIQQFQIIKKIMVETMEDFDLDNPELIIKIRKDQL